jgi:hypothetical protein
MSLITIFLLEIACLAVDLFYFHGAVLHIVLVCVLTIAGIVSLFKNRKKTLRTFLAIPVVATLSMTGYLIDMHLKNIVTEAVDGCPSVEKCNFENSYLGYRIRVLSKDQGFSKTRVVIDGYNYFFLIYDPATRTFTKGEV